MGVSEDEAWGKEDSLQERGEHAVRTRHDVKFALSRGTGVCPQCAGATVLITHYW
jgi:hypothetical protein